MSQQKETVTASLTKWIILIGLATSTVISGLYVLLYAQTGAQHMLVIAGLTALCIVCLALAAWMVRGENLEAAGYWAIVAVLVGYGGSELVAAGATLHITVGGILLVLLLGSVILPHRRRAWLVIAGLFGVYIWLVNRFEPLPRYDLAQSAVLRLYIIPATTALVVLMVVWRLLRARRRIETIGSRLVIDSVLLVLLPVGTISMLSGVLGWQSGRQQVINQLESVATLKEAEVNTWVYSLQTNLSLTLHEHQSSSLTVLLQEPAATRADYQAAYDELKEHFTLTIKETQLFDEVFLMDLQGRVVLSTDAAQEGKIHSNQAYFWEGLEGARVHPPFYSASLGRMSVVAVRPVVDGQGRTLGIVAGRASMATLSKIMLQRAGLGETGETYLVGSNHAMLTGSRSVVPEEEVGTYVRSEGANLALDTHVNGSGLYDDYRGAPVVGVYRWLPELQVALVAEQAQYEAFRPVYAVVGIDVGVAVVALIVAIVAALVVARGIAAPLTNLATVATRIAGGDLSVRAPVGGEGELGQLAASFNQMLESIQQAQQTIRQSNREVLREREAMLSLAEDLRAEVAERRRTEVALRESEQRFHLLFEEAPIAYQSLDAEGSLLEVNQAWVELLGYSREESIGRAFEEFVAPEDRERFRECFAHFKAVGEIHDVAFEVVRADGSHIIASFDGTAGLDEQGTLGQTHCTMQDVTERRRAEEALRDSERRFRDLYENAPNAYFSIGKDGRIRTCNRRAGQLLGYAAEELVGRPVLELYADTPRGKERALQVFERFRAGEAISDEELQMQRADGNPVWISLTVNAVRDAQGRVLESRSMVVDITERKRAEEALQESEAKMRSIFRAAPTGIGVVSDRLILDVNERFCEITGYSRDELIGKDARMVYPTDEEYDYVGRQKYRQIKEHGTGTMETRFRRKDGKIVDVLLSSTPLEPTDLSAGVTFTALDITDRKRALLALRESKQLLERTFASLRDAVFIIDAETVEILDCNPAAFRMFGYSRQEMLGRNTTFLHIDEASLEEFRAHLYPAVEETGLLLLPEFRMKRKDGTVFPTEHSVVPLEDEHGRRVGWVSVVRDITERQRAEEALHHSLEETARGQRMLLALSQAAQAVQRAHTSDAVFRTVGDEIAKLGYQATIFTLADDREHLMVSYLGFEPALVRAAEGLTGLSAQGYTFPVVPGGLFQRLMAEGDTAFTEGTAEPLAQALPKSVRPLVGRLADLLQWEQSIVAALKIGGQVHGLLAVTGAGLTEADMPAVTAFANQAAIALENARLYEAAHSAHEQLRDLASYLQDAREEERKRVAREVHDELGQTLTALKFDLAQLQKRLPGDEPDLRERVDAMAALIDGSVRTVRRVSTELRPGLLDDLGLAAAIEWQVGEFAERTGIRCDLQLGREDITLEPDVATALFRILQETLTNVARHAGANEAHVELAVDPQEVVLRVRDDGRGITESEISSTQALGLLGMRERARTLGGEVTFEGVAGQGTVVTTSIPRRGM